MTLDELKSLRKGEVVVITKVDEVITEFNNYQVDDELTFISINLPHAHYTGAVKFARKLTDEEENNNPGATGIIVHFSYEFCHYIERKVILERDRKLNEIGI